MGEQDIAVVTLAILRHGIYDSATGHLTEAGQQGLRRMAAKLYAMGIVPATIVTSDEPRAIESGDVLQDFFAQFSTRKIKRARVAELGENCLTGEFSKTLPNFHFSGQTVVGVTHGPTMKPNVMRLLPSESMAAVMKVGKIEPGEGFIVHADAARDWEDLKQQKASGFEFVSLDAA